MLQLRKPLILTKLIKNAVVDKTINDNKECNVEANKYLNTIANKAIDINKNELIKGES